MPSPAWTRVIVFATAAILVAIAVVGGVAPEDLLKLVGVIAIVLSALFWLLDSWLWKWLPVKLTKRPNIDGTWKAWLESGWTDPETGESGSRRCYLVVRQRLRTVTVTALFPDSDSESSIATIRERNGRYRLVYLYDSKAEPAAREGNPPHSGATELTISLDPKRMRGNYWGDRESSRGTIETQDWIKKHCDDFAAAESCF